jgi:hypothetical protein
MGRLAWDLFTCKWRIGEAREQPRFVTVLSKPRVADSALLRDRDGPRSSPKPLNNRLYPTTITGKSVRQNSTVLVLVNDADARDAVRRRLIDLDAIPLIVRADHAAAAIEWYRPIAAVLDATHAARASAGFLATTSAHRVRLLTLPDPRVGPGIGDDALREAVAPRRSDRDLPRRSISIS